MLRASLGDKAEFLEICSVRKNIKMYFVSVKQNELRFGMRIIDGVQDKCIKVLVLVLESNFDILRWLNM